MCFKQLDQTSLPDHHQLERTQLACPLLAEVLSPANSLKPACRPAAPPPAVAPLIPQSHRLCSPPCLQREGCGDFSTQLWQSLSKQGLSAFPSSVSDLRIFPETSFVCFSFFFIFKHFMEVELIYNVVLISAVQQSDSFIHIHISILFQILFLC